MDRIESLNIFIRNNLKLLLSKKFSKMLFKKAKVDYFLGGHNFLRARMRHQQLFNCARVFYVSNLRKFGFVVKIY